VVILVPGGWTLVRMGGRAGEENNWLLIKWNDAYALRQGLAALRKGAQLA
jgi:hypothetical protein